MVIPYRLNTMFAHWPVANWILIALTALVSFSAMTSDSEWISNMILAGWTPAGMIGHLFIHAGIYHLFGNLVALWVFGNAVCANTSNLAYPFLYLAFGLVAAATHNILDGSPAVGGSGAINGVVGMATAMYPLNRVSILWFFIIRAGAFEIPLWALSLAWLGFDLFGVVFGPGDVAVWAHIGGFLAGLLVGTVALGTGVVKLSEYDNRSLTDILFR